MKKGNKKVIGITLIILIILGVILFIRSFELYSSKGKATLVKVSDTAEYDCTNCMSNKTITIYNLSNADGKVDDNSKLVLRTTYKDGKNGKEKTYRARFIKASEYEKIYKKIDAHKDDHILYTKERTDIFVVSYPSKKTEDFYVRKTDLPEFDKLYLGNEV